MWSYLINDANLKNPPTSPAGANAFKLAIGCDDAGTLPYVDKEIIEAALPLLKPALVKRFIADYKNFLIDDTVQFEA
jgi:hypothetical protein